MRKKVFEFCNIFRFTYYILFQIIGKSKKNIFEIYSDFYPDFFEAAVNFVMCL